MIMKWKELKAHIEVMDKEQLDMDVVILNIDDGEYTPVKDIDFTVDSDCIKDNNPVLKYSNSY